MKEVKSSKAVRGYYKDDLTEEEKEWIQRK